MKQVFYCRYEPGRGLAAGAGPQPRAASPGVPLERLQAARLFAGAAPPTGFAEPPERLALFDTPLGRILAHSAGAGDDRFTHLLLDVPDTLDADHAARTWASPLWRRRDEPGGTDLPDLPFPPVADAITDESLWLFLADDRNRRVVRFALSALVRGNDKIIIAAPPETVARVVHAVGRAAPQSLLDELTFSTFEPAPLASPARIVGTCWPDPQKGDLPAAAYGAGFAGINTFNERTGDGAGDSPFAAFAVSSLAEGRPERLDEFRTTWQQLGVRDHRLLDLVYRVHAGETALTAEDARRALQHAGLTNWLVARPGTVEQLLDLALADAEFAGGPFARAVLALRGNADVLRRLTGRALDAGFAALRSGDVRTATTALETILPTVAPAKTTDVWAEALNRLPEPGALKWPARKFLLPRLAAPGVCSRDELAPWLHVDPQHLAEALALGLPPACQSELADAALNADPPADAAIAALAAHPRLAVTAVASLAERGGLPRARAALAGLFRAAPQENWLSRLTCSAAELPPGLLGAAVELALDHGQARPGELIRAHGADLPELLSDTPGLARLAAAFLADPPADLIDNAAALGFLAQLDGMAQVTGATKARAAAVRRIHAFLREPVLAEDDLKSLAAAWTVEPRVVPAEVRGRVVRAVVDALTREAGSAEAQARLEAVLARLGPVLADSPANLFRELTAALTARRAVWRAREMPAALMAVSLGAAEDPVLAATLDGLDGDAYALAVSACQRSGRHIREFDRRSALWPRPARMQWKFLARAVRPYTTRGLARDAAIFLTGAVLAVASAVVAGRIQAGG
jgi:hypothetical protein